MPVWMARNSCHILFHTVSMAVWAVQRASSEKNYNKHKGSSTVKHHLFFADGIRKLVSHGYKCVLMH